MPKLRIIVTGLIAQHPQMGGVAWDYLPYPVGLSRLGHDVYYFEDSGEWPYNLDGGETGDDWVARSPDRNLRHLADTLSRFGLGDRWAYRFPLDGSWHGLADSLRREVVRSADLVINVSGTLEHPEQYRAGARLAYIDSDPVFTQLKLLKKNGSLASRIHAHDVHFSFGETLGGALADSGPAWLPTRHPVLLEEWNGGGEARPVYSTVMNWTSYPPVVHDGESFGQKDAEFVHFLELPAAVEPLQLEVALARTQHVSWQTRGGELPASARALLEREPGLSPRELLDRHGWSVVDPGHRCSGLDGYRDYIRSSRGEWSVAKNGYVKGRPGWFSCRSCCYLAAGRPVVVQDTGFGEVIPCGTGVLAFATPAEAAEALRAVEADYSRHSQAALAIAAEYFDAPRVLAALVERAIEPAAIDSAGGRRR